MTEGPTNDLLRRMLAAIANDSSTLDVERLIAEARAQAEAEVVELVKSAVKASLLREVVRRLETGDSALPTGADESDAAGSSNRNDEVVLEDQGARRIDPGSSGATVCYVYAITRDLPDDWGTDVASIEEPYRLDIVKYRDLQAVVSGVPLETFGQAALDERTADREWVEAKIRAHDQVVKRVAEAGATVPCRFCTVVRGRADVELLLSAHYERLMEALAKVQGRLEWGLRILFDPAQVTAAPVGAAEVEPSGREYLRQRKDRESQQAQALAAARELARSVHEELAEVADEAVLLAARPGKGRVVELLNAAYLVNREDEGTFHEGVERLRGEVESPGLELVLSGPWPAYNFVQLDLSLEAAA